jgi:hypothetical protein
MKADDVTRAQARAIFLKVKPTADYLTRLRLRMGKRGFSDGDPLWELVRDAERALHLLRADTECRSIDGRGLDDTPKPPTLAKSKRGNSTKYLKRIGRD